MTLRDQPDNVAAWSSTIPSHGRTLRARLREWHVPTRHAGRNTTKSGVKNHERMIRALRAASGEARANPSTYEWSRSSMGHKSPKKQNVKKPSKTLKEKRADKQSKREDKRPRFGH